MFSWTVAYRLVQLGSTPSKSASLLQCLVLRNMCHYQCLSDAFMIIWYGAKDCDIYGTICQLIHKFYGKIHRKFHVHGYVVS